MANISTMNSNDVHNIVARFVKRDGNYRRLSYQQETQLRENMLDFVNSRRQNVDGFLEWLNTNFPDFVRYLNGA